MFWPACRTSPHLSKIIWQEKSLRISSTLLWSDKALPQLQGQQGSGGATFPQAIQILNQGPATTHTNNFMHNQQTFRHIYLICFHKSLCFYIFAPRSLTKQCHVLYQMNMSQAAFPNTFLIIKLLPDIECLSAFFI